MAAPPPPCRFFQVGSCTKGADCRFAHAKDAGDGGRLKLSQPCVFFAQGRCAYGDRCAYLHGDIHHNAIPTDSSTGRSSSQQSMHARISCPRSTPTNHPTQSASKSQGSEGITHGVRDATQSKIPIASPGAVNPHSQRSHLSGIERDSTAAPCGSGTFCSPSGVDPNELCKEMQNLRFAYEDDEVDGDFVATEEEKQASIAMPCAVCLDAVAPRRFGILTDCEHSVCLACIRQWRATHAIRPQVARACPVCRTPSHFVVPSFVFVSHPARKQALIEGELLALDACAAIIPSRDCHGVGPRTATDLRQDKP